MTNPRIVPVAGATHLDPVIANAAAQGSRGEATSRSSLRASLRSAGNRLKLWLHEQALPLWYTNGFLGAKGGYAETLTLAGKATATNRRSRVHPRQVFCFAEAGSRQWVGDWRNAVDAGMDYYERVYRLPDGFYASLADLDGKVLDASFDLYNQAFAILAYAHIAKAQPERAVQMGARASEMLEALQLTYAHPYSGFEEANPRKLPLCTNPHMHLFEAAMACEMQPEFNQGLWVALADQIAELCMSRFIDPQSGGLREFFDGDWKPYEGVAGRIMEPGHQFEWAWLLTRWATRRNRQDALAKAKRLFAIGEGHGICATRHVAVMALLDDFSVHDPLARLWPQTEWLKSALLLAVVSEGEEREAYMASALRAVYALDLFLEVPLKGLWRDKLKADGSFIEEDVPASSFYHILCAIYELEDCLARLA